MMYYRMVTRPVIIHEKRRQFARDQLALDKCKLRTLATPISNSHYSQKFELPLIAVGEEPA